jgi:hypothetical protein
MGRFLLTQSQFPSDAAGGAGRRPAQLPFMDTRNVPTAAFDLDFAPERKLKEGKTTRRWRTLARSEAPLYEPSHRRQTLT